MFTWFMNGEEELVRRGRSRSDMKNLLQIDKLFSSVTMRGRRFHLASNESATSAGFDPVSSTWKPFIDRGQSFVTFSAFDALHTFRYKRRLSVIIDQ